MINKLQANNISKTNYVKWTEAIRGLDRNATMTNYSDDEAISVS